LILIKKPAPEGYLFGADVRRRQAANEDERCIGGEKLCLDDSIVDGVVSGRNDLNRLGRIVREGNVPGQQEGREHHDRRQMGKESRHSETPPSHEAA
jgi:hypothetical protein